MNRAKQFISALGLCLATQASAATSYAVNLSGKVVDATGKGVPRVEVALKETVYKDTTDAS